jgi:hypothetical protein
VKTAASRAKHEAVVGLKFVAMNTKKNINEPKEHEILT